VTPDVVVDVGNTRMKWGLCRNGRIECMAAVQSLNPDAWTAKAKRWNLPRGTQWVVTFVNSAPIVPFVDWLKARGDNIERIVNEEVRLPIAVDEPAKVGIDRLLTALAAVRRVPSGRPVATISVGTAMTVDFVNTDGIFIGGQILPGPQTMAKSLRDHTAALPCVEAEPMFMSEYCGKNTVDAIKSGIYNAIIGAGFNAVWGFADEMGQPVSVFVTGGGYRFFSRDDFPDTATEIVFDKRLTLDGIRIAAEALP
jgi:type III pantothenate kinase